MQLAEKSDKIMVQEVFSLSFPELGCVIGSAPGVCTQSCVNVRSMYVQQTNVPECLLYSFSNLDSPLMGQFGDQFSQHCCTLACGTITYKKKKSKFN